MSSKQACHELGFARLFVILDDVTRHGGLAGYYSDLRTS